MCVDVAGRPPILISQCSDSKSATDYTYWNPTDRPARIIEIVSRAGFEMSFRELGSMLASGPPDPAAFTAMVDRYGASQQMDWIPDLMERYGLNSPM